VSELAKQGIEVVREGTWLVDPNVVRKALAWRDTPTSAKLASEHASNGR